MQNYHIQWASLLVETICVLQHLLMTDRCCTQQRVLVIYKYLIYPKAILLRAKYAAKGDEI